MRSITAQESNAPRQENRLYYIGHLRQSVCRKDEWSALFQFESLMKEHYHMGCGRGKTLLYTIEDRFLKGNCLNKRDQLYSLIKAGLDLRERNMPILALLDANHELRLPLEISNDDLGRIQSQLNHLSEHEVDVSPQAYFASILACEAISAEPARYWPPLNEKRSSEAKKLQNLFINFLSYHFLTMAYGQTVYAAIRQAAQLSLNCECIFRTLPMTPPRRRA